MRSVVRLLALAWIGLWGQVSAQEPAGAAALAMLQRANALHQLDSQASSRLNAEFSQFQGCLGGLQIRINEVGDRSAINVLVTKETPGKTVKCGHGAACYDPGVDVIFMDYSVVYAPFVSRQVGTSWVSRSDEDNRVRLYRQLVFLHELGHKLKHAAEKSPSTERRREMEDEADAFALQCLVASQSALQRGSEGAGVDAPGTSRSRVKPPRARTPDEIAALQVAEVVSEAGFALAYADQVSPFKATSQYRSFIDRSRGLLKLASARVTDQDIAVYLALAKENLDRMGQVAGSIAADVRDERIDSFAVNSLFPARKFSA